MADVHQPDPPAITRYLAALEGVEVVETNGDAFFFYDPERTLPPDRRLPFATLVTGDRYDQVSNLDRLGVYRLNLGVAKDTYRRLFGPPPRPPGPEGWVDTGHDYTALDQLLPHPVYAYLSWVCILSPSAATFEQTVQPLLAEAHQLAADAYARRLTRRQP